MAPATSTVSLARRALLLLGALPLLAAGLRAGVVVVDPGGGEGALLLSSAIASAQDGDVLLLRAGNYHGPFFGNYAMPNRSLTLVADAGGERVKTNGFTVPLLGAGRTIVLRGLEIGDADDVGSFLGRVEVFGGQGEAWLEDCTIAGARGSTVTIPFDGNGGLAVIDLPGAPAVEADDARVVITNCTLRGGAGQDGTAFRFPTTAGGPGLSVRHGAEVVLMGSTAIGGRGGDDVAGTTPGGGAGGAGVFVGGTGQGGSFLSVAGCTLVGGDGGRDHPERGGPGGAGLLGTDTDATVWLREVEAQGGQPGPSASPGDALNVVAGTLTSFDAPWAQTSLPAPLRAGQAATLAVDAVPNALVLATVAPAPGWLPEAAQAGVSLLDASLAGGPLLLGTADASTGALELPFHTPPLPAGTAEYALVIQLHLPDAHGAGTLGAATMLVAVSAGF
ncbi:MAG: right-handed parallel beta-helix repeat-containing protein [Planctomycetota bacterium]|jgi:hypothetical protein